MFKVKRKTVYERKKDDDDVADTDDADRSGLPVLEKEDIVKGYPPISFLFFYGYF